MCWVWTRQRLRSPKMLHRFIYTLRWVWHLRWVYAIFQQFFAEELSMYLWSEMTHRQGPNFVVLVLLRNYQFRKGFDLCILWWRLRQDSFRWLLGLLEEHWRGHWPRNIWSCGLCWRLDRRCSDTGCRIFLELWRTFIAGRGSQPYRILGMP